MTTLGDDKLKGRGDEFYAALMAAHEGLSSEESVKLNAKLVLILANEVGDVDVIKSALERAKRG